VGANFELIGVFYTILYGGDDVGEEIDSILLNPLA
jgi:hypothetical protein